MPAEKLDHQCTLLAEWEDMKACTHRVLESLIGHLNQVCKVVRPGRLFLRMMIDLQHHCTNAHHIHLNRGFWSDLKWWKMFATTWNGTSYLASNTTAQFASDASGTWGCRGYVDPMAMGRNFTIVVKELLPIVLAALLWGPAWHSLLVLGYRDNEAVVAVLRSWTCKQPDLMYMLRCLFFVD